MPLSRDPGGGGTNADGSKSDTYCSLCYENGAFLQDGITAAEMQKHCIEQMHKQGVPRLAGWMMTRRITRLERWKAKK
jgi:hypothetical protein